MIISRRVPITEYIDNDPPVDYPPQGSSGTSILDWVFVVLMVWGVLSWLGRSSR